MSESDTLMKPRDIPQMRSCDLLSNCTTGRIHMSFIDSISPIPIYSYRHTHFSTTYA